ncbi:MAG: hypothetical protein PVG78_18810, partial [Desulfobacterales bacterium]
MAKGTRKGERNLMGYGSSYRKGRPQDIGQKEEIGAVLGSQLWLVKPDKQAKLAHPCLWMQAGVVNFKS